MCSAFATLYDPCPILSLPIYVRNHHDDNLPLHWNKPKGKKDLSFWGHWAVRSVYCHRAGNTFPLWNRFASIIIIGREKSTKIMHVYKFRTVTAESERLLTFCRLLCVRNWIFIHEVKRGHSAFFLQRGNEVETYLCTRRCPSTAKANPNCVVPFC